MSSHVKNLVADLISRYKQKDNLELEIRLKEVSKEVFSTVVSSVSESPDFIFDSIEHSINTISQNVSQNASSGHQTESRIRKQVFKDLKKISDEYIRKTPEKRPVYFKDYINYSVCLSEETSSKKYSSNIDAGVRMKIRISFLTLDKEWRVDCTAVKQSKLNDIGPILNEIFKKMFIPKTSKNFLTKLDYSYIDQFEIEIEHVGDKTKVEIESLDVVKKIFSMLSPSYSVDAIIAEEIADMAEDILVNRDHASYYRKGKYGMKRLLNQAISLTTQSYSEIYPPHDMFATEKADGFRCAIRITKNRCRFLTDKLTEIKIETTTKKSEPDIVTPTTIADSELIVIKTDANGKYTEIQLLIFDVMMFEGKSIASEGFEERMKFIPEVAKIVETFYKNKSELFPVDFKLTVKPKNFVKLSKDMLEEQFTQVYKTKYDYYVDGLMIVKPGDTYFKTTWLKWKPIKDNSIDFLAVRADSKFLGINPFIPKDGYDLYILFVGIRYEMLQKLGLELMLKYDQLFPNILYELRRSHKKDYHYIPIQFSPSYNPTDFLYYHKISGEDIHMKIVELRKDMKPTKENTLGEWELIRVRHDRKGDSTYYGNDFRVAELTHQNYVNPLNFEDLYNFSMGYFMKSSDTSYKPKNGFHRFVVSNIIKKYTCVETPINRGIDFASGRGADLHRFQQCGVKKMVFTDIDKNALTELVQRKFQLMRDRKHTYVVQRAMKRYKTTKGMAIQVMELDLKEDHQTNITAMGRVNIYPETFEYANCSFAIHYLCDNVKNIRNFATLANKMMKLNSVLTISVMNGEKVFKELEGLKTGESLKMVEGDVAKYEIRKKYSGTTIAPTGQLIEIFLPFTDVMYEEPLCNITYLTKEMKIHGFSLEMSGSFSDYLDQFETANRVMYEQISDVDKSYIDLHQYMSFKKTKNLKPNK